MLKLVTGLKTLDVIYNKVRKERGIIISPFEGGFEVYEKIRIENTYVKHIVFTLMLKLFKIEREEYSIIRESLAESQTLKDFFNRIGNHNFRDVNLNYLVDLYRDITAQRRYQEDLSYVRTWPTDPFCTFLTLSALLYFYQHNIDRPVLIYLTSVDNVIDMLLMFRRMELYVFSLRASRLEFFDEAYIYVPPRIDKYGIVKIRNDIVVRCTPTDLLVCSSPISISFSVTKLDDVSREILSSLSELGFMSLNALRESVAHQLGVDKSVVDSCVLKLERMGLVELRYLPDGRVVVLPTLLGLVKAKELC
ncbi:MAG: hypothetical protein GXO23_06825 [Crenarchaeota archaeon]|nr:hypothetical protein [Thermoproteota archaeon]